MAVSKLHIVEFLTLGEKYPILDVRSPGEYGHAHIPGAVSMPLFSDEERKTVGTLYKQQSREAAIKTGLDFFGVKMRRMVEETEALFLAENRSAFHASARTVLVHCWRGGMRSAGVAWLLDLYGFKVYTLTGGYKMYRRWVLEQFHKPWTFHVLGGYTGSGKTELLNLMKSKDQFVIDLEALASHKGSAFGAIGLARQPSQEMFENKLADSLFRAGNHAADACSVPIWIEDESQRIGSVNLPQPFWNRMRECPVIFLDIPFDERLAYLVRTYGKLNRGDLAAAITRIQKRLGGLETKTALHHLVEGNMSDCFAILLKYYDKRYGKGLLERENLEKQLFRYTAKTVNPVLGYHTIQNYLHVTHSDGGNN
jgi:tRNA 2-selenouridine synthase